MVALSIPNFLRPRRNDYDWQWFGDDADRTSLRAVADVALRYIAEPPDLGALFNQMPHHEPSDAVLTGERGALSQHVIYGLAQSLSFESYLEVGTRFGYSIGAVLAASPRLRYAVTIDPFVDPKQIRGNLNTLDRPDVDLQVAKVASRQFDTDRLYDAVYVDGDHTYEMALADLKQYWKYVRPGGLLLADDTINKRGRDVVSRDAIGVYWAMRDFLAEADHVGGAVLQLPTYSGLAIVQKATRHSQAEAA